MNRSRRIFVAALVALFVGTSMTATEAATPSSKTTYQKYYSYRIVRVQPKPAPAPTPKPTTTPTPAPVANTDVNSQLTAQEQQMINLVNQERAKYGLPALQVDMRLVKIARLKSQDMIKNNYFSHQSPTYGSPFDMMKSQGITYRTAGENIAGNRTVTGAHTSLMNSPGHRANILSSNFTKIGIGIVQGGPYGLMITQEFIG